MYEYISGKITEITPDHVVLETQGIGYFLHISLNTYEKYNKEKGEKFYIHQSIKEDAHTLYGFYEKSERALFKLLISVSGIGTNTARLMLSSLSPNQLIGAISTESVGTIKAIKGIGPKTAQRVILDLKDKVLQVAGDGAIFVGGGNKTADEALSALLALGFNKIQVNKIVAKILETTPESSVEDIIKLALKKL